MGSPRPGTRNPLNSRDPLNFCCWRCRLDRHYRMHVAGGTRKQAESEKGSVSHVEFTGRQRTQRKVSASPRSSGLRVEYVCADCDHRGWTNHVDAVREAARQGKIEL